MPTTLNEHIVTSYEDELTNLNTAISEMGGMVEQAITEAASALLRLDPVWNRIRGDSRLEKFLAKEPAAAVTVSSIAPSDKLRASSVAKAGEDRSEDPSGKALAPDEKSVAVLAFANTFSATSADFDAASLCIR